MSAGDAEAYVKLWHDDSVGWPCFEWNPTGKENIGNWVRDIRDNHWKLTYELKPLAVKAIRDDIAIAHYAVEIALINGVGGAHLSTAPLFNPSEFNAAVIFGGLSIATLAFLGFDAISTLSEEARGRPSMVGRATLLSLFLAAGFFVLHNYFLSLFVLGQTSFAPGEATDAAFYRIAGMVGGLFVAFLISFFSGAPGALAAQAATARLLFSMARDGKLPRPLAHVHTKRQVPDRAILFVAVVSLIVAIGFTNKLELLASMVNFGALTGFLMLHVSVIVHFMWRQRSRQWLRHLIVPLIGFPIIGYVLLNMAVPAKIAGIAWLAVGVVVLIGIKLGGRRTALIANAVATGTSDSRDDV